VCQMEDAPRTIRRASAVQVNAWLGAPATHPTPRAPACHPGNAVAFSPAGVDRTLRHLSDATGNAAR
jgi:hypothetical protein